MVFVTWKQLMIDVKDQSFLASLVAKLSHCAFQSQTLKPVNYTG